ncbi:protoporphyrinogen oxidase [Aquibacillus rhizosphaerae]|uniref:Coproporphyrinogen III oxidase n=1 Tax=Aquibacillus rhizosphaerae TaxID=3051431 RepID=A0ABT7LBY4_9BACI|nr:protoporphyrinogen oxidase [Aquibacillus sp. LR5S19]MDL4842705.1 protoporphyrinogen oxidase [Aquibacillus sp. LR5S19]
MKTVLVIGGGITGLTTMYELQKWKKRQQSDIDLILAESNETLGGKISTIKDEDFIVEKGADSIVSRKINDMPYIKELGLEKELVYNASGKSYLYTEGQLKQIPDDAVFGIPMSVESLAKSTLVSADGKVEALKDIYTRNETFTKEDSIGEFLEYFLGKELVEKQIAPVLSGVYSGNLSDLTIGSTLPYLIDYKEKFGSIIKGFEANKEKFKSSGDKKFLSFKGGLGAFIDAFENALDQVQILKNSRATNIETENNRYKVSFANGEIIKANQVVLSVPNTEVESLFTDNQLDEYIAPFQSSSLISVYLGFDISDQILPMDGTGFIKANSNDIICNACTWTSKKWKHTSGKGNLLVRLFYKSNLPNFTAIQDMSEEGLLQLAREDVSKSLGITTDPITSEVTKWNNNMPKYQMTHPQAVHSLENKLKENYPGIWISGCSYYGVGIPDCMQNGKDTALKIIESLTDK